MSIFTDKKIADCPFRQLSALIEEKDFVITLFTGSTVIKVIKSSLCCFVIKCRLR